MAVAISRQNIVFVLAVLLSLVLTANADSVDREPVIEPDYASVTIPPNIAPLNFAIREDVTRAVVQISTDTGKVITVKAKDNIVEIPQGKWSRLLQSSAGQNLYFDITARTRDGRDLKYKRITNHIAPDPIDGYLAYRFMKPIYNGWANIEIRQRNLATFDDSRIIHGKSFGRACMNCHTFPNNEPDQMALGIRGKYGVGTLLAANGTVQKINSKWGYTEWHPNGRIAVYSINKVRQFFHAVRKEVRDVVDLDSGIVYYDVDAQQIRTTPALTEPDRLETYPAWTPDGKWLYFCSAPILWDDRDTVPPKNFDKVRYDLRRISYDAATDTWGDAETVLTAEQADASLLIPKISPDGNFMIFCMTEYGCFPVYQPNSDLAIMDLRTGEWHKLDHTVNSEFSESWHCFSSNGRWLTFSSKRIGGLFTRTYFCHIDPAGNVSKAFVMPQEDPLFYGSCIQTYSLPQLIKGPVKYSQRQLAEAAMQSEQIEVSLPVTGATPKLDQDKDKDAWKQLRE